MERVHPEGGAPCPSVDGFSRDPDWTATPIMVLVTPEFRRYEDDGLCADTFPRTDCELLAQSVGIQVFRCPPQW